MHTELEASLSSGLCLPSSVGQESFNFLEANLSQIHSLGLQFASRNEKKINFLDLQMIANTYFIPHTRRLRKRRLEMRLTLCKM